MLLLDCDPLLYLLTWAMPLENIDTFTSEGCSYNRNFVGVPNRDLSTTWKFDRYQPRQRTLEGW